MKTALLNFIIKYVVVKVLNNFAAALPILLKQWLEGMKKKHRDKVQEEATKKYEEIVSKPEATVEEKAKAYEDLINSGRF